ncbi:MAG: HlyD family efflux transporter periplasmic adaptor subunit [Rhodospirillales bacterium]|nr:HlyD family efflux transporter periplasmic adaptor subunit [Rhodospirillales bacterium]
MIRRLRRAPVVDTFGNDARAAKGRFGQWVYLALIAAFFLWVGDLFVGSLLRLRADGLVVAEHVSVAVPFAAQVIQTETSPGAVVEAGSVVARVSSVALAQDIALLTARNADLLVRRLELERETRVAEAVLPVARHRAGEAETALRKIESYRGAGDIGLTLWMQTLRDRFETRERVAELSASLASAGDALGVVGGAIGDATTALDDLRGAYGDGLIRAPVAGTVGLRMARPGEVVSPGEPLLVLYRPERFVLAYLETGGLYTVQPGDPVELSSGFVQASGVVSDVLPVADQLPPEFQKTFQPRQRGQVVRITLADPDRLPLFAKVTVSGRGWLSDLVSSAVAAAATFR